MSFDLSDLDSDRFGLSKALRESGIETDEAERLAQLSVSIRIHQVRLEENRDIAAVIRLFAWVASSRTLEEHVDLTGVDDRRGALLSLESIAEVFVPLPPHADEQSDDQALDTALEAVRELQRSYSLAFKSPVRLVSRTNIPAIIPVTRGAAGFPRMRVDDFYGIRAGAVDPVHPSAALDDSQLDLLVATLNVGDRSPATRAYAELRRDAEVQYRRHGELRAAAMTAGIAGEVFMTTLHQWLLWEDGHAPEDVAGIFGKDGKRAVNRLTSDLPVLLGGSWRAGHGAIGAYLDSVVQLRHKVAHIGYSPSQEEVSQSLTALDNACNYALDRLTNPTNLRSYTRTAIALIGAGGLHEERLTTKRVRTLLDSDEPDWLSTFQRWRGHLDRANDPSSPAPGTNGMALRLVVILDDSGEARLVVMDTYTNYAAATTAKELQRLGVTDIDELDDLDETASLIREHPEADHAGVVGVLPPMPGLDWQQDHLVVPWMHIHHP